MKKAILPLILSISIILFYAEEKNYLNQLFKENITVKTDKTIDKEDLTIKPVPTNQKDEAHFLITYKNNVSHIFKHKQNDNSEDYFYTFKIYQKNNTTLLDVAVKNKFKEHYTSILNSSSKGKNQNLWP